MNIFVLDPHPEACARYHCDKHVVKMVLETAQILSSALHLHGIDAPYKPTHLSHPCVLWAAETRGNFRWLAWMGVFLAVEYTCRYNKVHASEDAIDICLVRNRSIPNARPRTPFVQCMPEQYRQEDPVLAYRAYYRGEKSKFATWKAPSQRPDWMDEG